MALGVSASPIVAVVSLAGPVAVTNVSSMCVLPEANGDGLACAGPNGDVDGLGGGCEDPNGEAFVENFGTGGAMLAVDGSGP